MSERLGCEEHCNRHPCTAESAETLEAWLVRWRINILSSMCTLHCLLCKNLVGETRKERYIKILASLFPRLPSLSFWKQERLLSCLILLPVVVPCCTECALAIPYRSYLITGLDCELDCWTGLMDWITWLNLFISHDFHPIKCCKFGYSNYLIISCTSSSHCMLVNVHECTS